MTIEILFFGQLTDITGCSTLTMNNPGSIDALQSALVERYPILASSKYRIALNNKIVQENTDISPNSKIALMPPFSGG